MKEEIKILQKLGTGCNEIVGMHNYQETFDPENGTMETHLVLDL